MNIEKPKIKIKKRENKMILIDNETWKILTNAESEKYLLEAFFNLCIEENQEEPENLLSKKSQEIIRNNIIKYKTQKIKEKREDEEWEKLKNNSKSFDIIVFIFLFHIVEIVLLLCLFHI